jgi:hypothetical protein
MPIASMISATESPAAGVAASEISTIPNSTPSARRPRGDQLAGTGNLKDGAFNHFRQFG